MSIAMARTNPQFELAGLVEPRRLQNCNPGMFGTFSPAEFCSPQEPGIFKDLTRTDFHTDHHFAAYEKQMSWYETEVLQKVNFM